jgi:inosine-uridine nucleoside N-ribohydrolase
MRVVIDNDYAGDPDDLFQTAHHLFSPSVEVRAIVASVPKAGDPLCRSGEPAAESARIARELLRVMRLEGELPVHEGAASGLRDGRTLAASAGSAAIVEEAMREDAGTPLFVVCGGGLTSLASALITEPRIAGRMTAVWIGGAEHPGLALPPPGASGPEYNASIDIEAVRYVFGRRDLPLWQVPRNAYRQCLVSLAELERRVLPRGPLGRYLYESIERALAIYAEGGLELGETYALGDSPLVSLTALQSAFDPDPSSCEYALVDRPSVEADGSYGPAAGGAKMRVYGRIDTRLLFEDLFAKLERFAEEGRGA